MKKWISGFLFWLISAMAYADSNSFVHTTISSDAVNNATDLSVAYLAQIFGTVGSTLHGTSGQMLGMLFYKFNEGVIVLAGLWLSYLVFTTVLRSAQEGSFMGQNKNVALLFLRIALGVGLLIPNPTTGYSVLQDIVMKIVVEGVSLADETWSYGLDYMANGGSLWIRPFEGTTGGDYGSSSMINAAGEKTMLVNFSNKIFNNEVCMVASSLVTQPTQTSTVSNTGVANTGSITTTAFHPIVDTKNYRIDFPGVGDSITQGSRCGYVSWASVQSAGVKSTANTADMSSLITAQNAVNSMVEDMLPAAQSYVCSNSSNSGTNTTCSGVETDNVLTNNSNIYFGSLVNYLNAILPVAQNNTHNAATSALNFVSDAKSSGWMIAGRYYWDLGRVQSAYNQVTNLQNYVPTEIGVPTVSDPSIQNMMKNALLAAGDGTQENTYVSNGLAKLANYQNTSEKGDTGGDYPYGKRVLTNIGNWIISLLLGPLVTGVVALLAMFSQGGLLGMGPDPMLFLHTLGEGCMSLAGAIWFTTALGLFAASAATLLCNATVNIPEVIQSVSAWLQPLMMTLGAAFLMTGIMLGYYVPLYPYMIFTFGVIGWLMAVIEAMVAAPLIALGLTHPDTHDFLGKSEQAMMLLVGIFLRPVLMIIGLIAAMILSYVSMRIVVYTYTGFIRDLFYLASPIPGSSDNVLQSVGIATGVALAGDTAGLGGLLGLILVFPLLLVVFAGLIYVVTTQCYTLIHTLPEYIMRWIGGPAAQGANPMQMADQVKGIEQSYAKSAAKGMEAGAASEKTHQEGKKSKASVKPMDGGDAGGGGAAGGAGGGAAGGAGGLPPPAV